jgi:Fuc2NAc and GlcNAc transferase
MKENNIVIMLFLNLLIGILSYFLVMVFRIYAIHKKLLDQPNHRSSHVIPIPVGAGVVFPVLLIILLLILYFFNFIDIFYLIILIPPVVAISLVGFLDDKYKLASKWRFLVQILGAIYSVFIIGEYSSINLGFIGINLNLLGYFFAILMLLWSTNLYNFMDGIDGIAAIEAIFIFGVGGVFIWYSGGAEFAVIIWSIVAIAIGFLIWNKPPAKIFMGDVGSTLLGFLVVLFGLIGEIWYNVPFLLWVILYGVFLFDATVTLLRRIKHGDVWYHAHRLHAYQRLQLQKWSHKKILFGIIVVNIILAVLAIFGFLFPQYIVILLAVTIILLSIVYWRIEKIQPMY